MFGPKTLNETLAKVTAFINDLEAGIEGNNANVASKQATIDGIKQSIDATNAQTQVAAKLLAKLQ